MSYSLLTLSADAAGLDTQRINGYDAQARLGNGTGVIVGIVDSGIDVNHPALAGTVSGGQSRLVAEANFVTTEPTNTGDDVYGHGTAVAGQILSRDTTHEGIATDARYVDARVLDSNNSFSTDSWVINGTGFALANGANLLNLSLGYFNSNTSGNSTLSLLTDYITYGLRIPITISAGNAGSSSNHLPQGPGDAYNVFSLGSRRRWHLFSRGANKISCDPLQTDSFPYLSHDFVDLEWLQGRGCVFQLNAPCHQNLILTRFLRFLFDVLNYLTDRLFPILKSHLLFLCNASLEHDK